MKMNKRSLAWLAIFLIMAVCGTIALRAQSSSEVLRPPKGAKTYTPVSIRHAPRALAWAKREAKTRGLGYQTIITQVLLKASA